MHAMRPGGGVFCHSISPLWNNPSASFAQRQVTSHYSISYVCDCFWLADFKPWGEATCQTFQVQLWLGQIWYLHQSSGSQWKVWVGAWELHHHSFYLQAWSGEFIPAQSLCPEGFQNCGVSSIFIVSQLFHQSHLLFHSVNHSNCIYLFFASHRPLPQLSNSHMAFHSNCWSHHWTSNAFYDQQTCCSAWADI